MVLEEKQIRLAHIVVEISIYECHMLGQPIHHVQIVPCSSLQKIHPSQKSELLQRPDLPLVYEEMHLQIQYT